jgi:hypothetical protein
MPPAGFEEAIPETERPQSHALDFLKNSFTNTHNRFYVVIKTQVGEIENPWG